MNPEQVEFLKQLEEEFKDSYTEEDSEYIKCFETPKPDPPVIKLSEIKPRSYYNEGNWKNGGDRNQRKSNLNQARFERRPSPYNSNNRGKRRHDDNGGENFNNNKRRRNGYRDGDN